MARRKTGETHHVEDAVVSDDAAVKVTRHDGLEDAVVEHRTVEATPLVEGAPVSAAARHNERYGDND